jgi:hypothetical protein
MVAGQKPFFAVFGSRVSSEMQEPFANVDDAGLPPSLRRANRQERTAIALCRLMYGSIKFGGERARVIGPAEPRQSHDDHVGI